MDHLEKEEEIISDFLKSVGPWSKHVIIGGGYALIIFKLYFANDSIGSLPVGTRDIDTLISRKISGEPQKNLAEFLRAAGFQRFYRNFEFPATEAYVKEINDIEVEIEFLTDNAVRANKNKNVEIAGIVAQPLSYIILSLQRTKEFKTKTGEKGFVVSPGAWILHKGLTFPKRKSDSKVFKDLYGIWYVATQLGRFSKEAIDELSFLGDQNQAWFKKFRRNLLKWIENASPIEWSKLEVQDPFGGLKKNGFERLINQLLL